MRKRTDRFEPERFAFDSNDFGISLDFQGTDENSAQDHFRLILDDNFMAKILEETTRYNLCLIQKISLSKRLQGIDTNIPEKTGAHKKLIWPISYFQSLYCPFYAEKCGESFGNKFK